MKQEQLMICPRCKSFGIVPSKTTPDAVNICERCHGDGMIPYSPEPQPATCPDSEVASKAVKEFADEVCKMLQTYSGCGQLRASCVAHIRAMAEGVGNDGYCV